MFLIPQIVTVVSCFRHSINTEQVLPYGISKVVNRAEAKERLILVLILGRAITTAFACVRT